MALLLTELNLDCLLKIFSYLDKDSLVSTAQTCKAICSVAYHPSLWENYIIKYKAEETLTERTARSFKSRRINVCKISLPSFKVNRRLRLIRDKGQVTDDQLKQQESTSKIQILAGENMIVLSSEGNIVTLDFETYDVGYDINAIFPASFHSLIQLRLVVCIDYSAEQQAKALENLNHALTSLENLRHFTCVFKGPYRMCGNAPVPILTGPVMPTLLLSLPNLQSLSLKQGGCLVATNMEQNLIQPAMNSLILPESAYDFAHQYMKPDDILQLSKILETFPCLKHLRIGTSRLLEHKIALDSPEIKLESLAIYMDANGYEEFMPASLNKLIALKIQQWNHMTKPATSLINHTKLTNLKVLIITPWEQAIEIEDIIQQDTLTNLEVLSLMQQRNDQPPCTLRNGVLMRIERKMPKLRSLLGVECINSPALPSTVIYVTRFVEDPVRYSYTIQMGNGGIREEKHKVDPTWTLQVVKRGSSGWIEIPKSSKVWEEATGEEYFKDSPK